MIGDKLQTIENLRDNMHKYNVILDLFSQMNNTVLWAWEDDDQMIDLLDMQILAAENTVYTMLKKTETVYTQLKEEDDNG